MLVRSIEWWKYNIEGRESNDIQDEFGGMIFISPMTRLCGKTVTVDKKVYPGKANRLPYFTVVEEDGNPSEWCWSPYMFERVVE